MPSRSGIQPKRPFKLARPYLSRQVRMASNSINEEAERAIKGLKKLPETDAIIIFGSAAKGKMKPLSDIDIAVIARESTKKAEAEISSFSSRLLDVVVFQKLPLYIQFEALKNGRPVFIRSRERFAQAKAEVLRNYLEMSHSYQRMSRMVLA